MLIPAILFILGFALLIKGADFLVDGSSSIAKRYGISNIVIGLTIVAFGTSFPELVISSLASFNNSAGIAFGNIIGSNISNTLLILGVSALIHSLYVKNNTVKKEIPFSVLAIFAVFFLANDKFLNGAEDSFLNRADGMVLLLFFSIFIYYTFGIAQKKEEADISDASEIKEYSVRISVLMIILGLLGLYFGGEWIVGGAIYFAKALGVSEVLIGLTIVAVGTSLPELAAAATAAFKNRSDIAIGAVVGSNIFNLLWVLGFSSVVAPIAYDQIFNRDFLVLLIISILLLFLIFYRKRNFLGKEEGVLLLVLYFIYMLIIIIEG